MYRTRIRPSRYVNTLTRKKEISLQISTLRECKYMNNEDIVDREQVVSNAYPFEAQKHYEQTIQSMQEELETIQAKVSRPYSIHVQRQQKLNVMESYERRIRVKEVERQGFEAQRQKITRLNHQMRQVKNEIQRKEEDLSTDFETEKQQQKEKIQTLLTKQTASIKERECLLLNQLKSSICKESIQRVVNVQNEKLLQLQSQLAQFSRTKKELEEKRKQIDKEREQIKKRIADMKVRMRSGSDIVVYVHGQWPVPL